MGQILHGSATTTEAICRAIQDSQESLRPLAKHYCGSADRAEGAEIDRPIHRGRGCRGGLPLDDCLYALQATIPHLTRSSLHRCLHRHGISRLPEVEGDKPAKKKFKSYPIGYFHIDIAEVRTAQGKLYLFVAIDPTRSSPLLNCMRKPRRALPPIFCEHFSKRFLTRCVPFSPTTAHTSRHLAIRARQRPT